MARDSAKLKPTSASTDSLWNDASEVLTQADTQLTTLPWISIPISIPAASPAGAVVPLAAPGKTDAADSHSAASNALDAQPRQAAKVADTLLKLLAPSASVAARQDSSPISTPQPASPNAVKAEKQAKPALDVVDKKSPEAPLLRATPVDTLPVPIGNTTQNTAPASNQQANGGIWNTNAAPAAAPTTTLNSSVPVESASFAAATTDVAPHAPVPEQPEKLVFEARLTPLPAEAQATVAGNSSQRPAEKPAIEPAPALPSPGASVAAPAALPTIQPGSGARPSAKEYKSDGYGKSIFPSTEAQTVTAAAPSSTSLPSGSAKYEQTPVLSKPATLPMDQQMTSTSQKTDLNMRLQGQSGENINIRVFERGGEIQVAVRSSDQTVTTALRHELPSLQSSLQNAGWHMSDVNLQQQTAESNPERHSSDQQRQRAQQDGSPDQQQQKKRSSLDEWFELGL